MHIYMVVLFDSYIHTMLGSSKVMVFWTPANWSFILVSQTCNYLNYMLNTIYKYCTVNISQMVCILLYIFYLFCVYKREAITTVMVWM